MHLHAVFESILIYMNFALRTVAFFLPVAVGITALASVSYLQEQQMLRGGANEPQRTIAYHALAQLTAGALPSIVATSTTPVAIESDPSTFLMATDDNGIPLSGTGYLNGVLPSLPGGIFDVARSNGIDELTWQPETGVREAIVVLKAPGGFVVTGRSLRYTELEENKLTERAAVGWVGEMLAILIASLLAAYLSLRFKR
jgi:hypothetical protein